MRQAVLCGQDAFYFRMDAGGTANIVDHQTEAFWKDPADEHCAHVF